MYRSGTWNRNLLLARAGGAMTLTLEERRAKILARLGLSAWPTLLEEAQALVEKIVPLLKNEKGYDLVSPPKPPHHKKWHARTSGAPCGQRSLGSFSSAEEAASRVAMWIIGLVPTPLTPSKERRKRGSGEPKPKKDRCSHGKGAHLKSLSLLSHTATPASQVVRTCAPASTGRRSRRRRAGCRPRCPARLPLRAACRCSPPNGRRWS